jgi:hypothetical protein
MKAEVTFIVEAPVDCTYEEFIEWISFKLGYTGSMARVPLGDYELEALKITSLTIIPSYKKKATEGKD